MKKLVLVLFAMTGCFSGKHETTVTLIGKTVEYKYGESIYLVTFNSDSTLHWEAMSGDEKGLKENETFVSAWININQLFISWGEANGTGVSQILDFEKGKVYNHLLHGREASKGEGEIRILK